MNAKLSHPTPHRYATPARKELKVKHWHPLKERIRSYLAEAGSAAAIRLANHLGCHPSQIHRYTCPVCEHGAEPTYSTAIAIIAYLDQWEFLGKPKAEKKVPGNLSANRNRAGKPRKVVEATLTRRTLGLLAPSHITGKRN